MKSNHVMPNIELLEHTLMSAGTPFGVAQIQGLMMGALCTFQERVEDCWVSLMAVVPFASPDPSLAVNSLNNLFYCTRANLLSDEEGITLLLPEDDYPLNHRLEALAKWCEGFLQGIKLQNKKKHMSDPMINEILNDFTKFSQLSLREKASEDNEKAYMELVEYIRVAVLLVFAENTKSEVKCCDHSHHIH